jgi:arginyl-tRNA synthetase
MAQQTAEALSSLSVGAADGPAPPAARVPPSDGVASISQELTALFTAGLRTALPAAEEGAQVVRCNNAKFGDYQCNNAMALFGKLKGTVSN